MSSFMMRKQQRDSGRRKDRWRAEEEEQKRKQEEIRERELKEEKERERELKEERDREEEYEMNFKSVISIKSKKDVERFNRLLLVFGNVEYQKEYKFISQRGMNVVSGDEIAVIINNIHFQISPNYINAPILKKYIYVKGKGELNQSFKELLVGLGVENTKGNQEFIKNVSKIFKLYETAIDLRKKLV